MKCIKMTTPQRMYVDNVFTPDVKWQTIIQNMFVFAVVLNGLTFATILTTNYLYATKVSLAWCLTPTATYFVCYLIFELFTWLAENVFLIWLYAAKQKLAKELGLEPADICWVSLSDLRDSDYVLWWTGQELAFEERAEVSNVFVVQEGAFILTKEGINKTLVNKHLPEVERFLDAVASRVQ